MHDIPTDMCKFVELLEEFDACGVGLTWISDQQFATPQEMWDALQAPAWMLWYLDRCTGYGYASVEEVSKQLIKKKRAMLRYMRRHDISDINIDILKSLFAQYGTLDRQWEREDWLTEVIEISMCTLNGDLGCTYYDKLRDKLMANHLREIFPYVDMENVR